MGDAIDTPSSRPFILIVCHQLSGHLSPLIRIAKGLHEHGWEVGFLGPTAHRPGIERAGAEFFPLTGAADLNDKLYYEKPPFPEYNSLNWVERVKVDLRLQCIEPIPLQWENFKSTLQVLHQRDAARQVIVVCEAFFLGVLPLKFGAPLPVGIEMPKTVCVSVTVPALRSIDLPPVGYPLPFDQTPEGRARNERMWLKWSEKGRLFTELLDQKLLAAGAKGGTREPFLAGANYRCHDTILQLGVPSFEYPRCDWPKGFKFAGLVQGTPKRAATGLEPSFPWWQELKENSALPADNSRRKKVLVVAQGTVEINPNDLIIPAIQAFAKRQDIIIVAILGWKDAHLAGYEVPSNARIADYLSYDAVLEHADVWINNAGFGAINHGIANGVAMVVAGEGMDKTENARRVGWSGVGINLDTAKPTVEQIRQGVETVLSDGRFKDCVLVLKKEAEEIDCFELIHRELLTLVDHKEYRS